MSSTMQCKQILSVQLHQFKGNIMFPPGGIPRRQLQTSGQEKE